MMTTIISIFAALLLGGYLVAMRTWCGQADMVSDTYYQLKKACGQGWPFSAILLCAAILMMGCMLDTGKGLQCMAFVGTAGLGFVAMAPNYLSQEEYAVHKTGAIVAALGCTAWCLTVGVWPTVVITIACALYLAAIWVTDALKEVWWIRPFTVAWHPWYWLEVACFANTFATYWIYC